MYSKKYDSPGDLPAILNQHLERWELLYGDEKKDRSPEERFSYVIERAWEKTGMRVVILIDEYDKPLLQAIDNDELQNEYRNTLKAFYGVMKSMDGYIQFVFLTGVTKFGKVSVFSDLELHYQNVLFIVFKLLDFYVKVEYHTSEGRIDLVLQTDRFIYVMEFKLNGTAEEALQQIDDKGYALPFVSDPRTLFRIGINFSAQTRNIEKWLVE